MTQQTLRASVNALGGAPMQLKEGIVIELLVPHDKIDEVRKIPLYDDVIIVYGGVGETFREQSDARVRDLGYEPRGLQWKWRNDPPKTYRPGEPTAAVVDALVHEGIEAWPGDGTGCVAQIIEKLHGLWQQAEARADKMQEWVSRLIEEVDRLNEDGKYLSILEGLADSNQLARAQAMLAEKAAERDGAETTS